MSLRSELSDIFNERTHYDFIGRRRTWFAISALVILVGFIALATRGLNFGIDFEGGTAWEVKSSRGVSIAAVRNILESEGVVGFEVAVLGGDTIRVQAERVLREEQAQVAEALAAYARAEVADVSITDVGPTWGEEVSNKAYKALAYFFVVIALYLSLRFEPKMALAALVAVVHDIFITVSAYALTGFEVTPATIIAFLTILGFSLYDTVVVFDKVRENAVNLATGGRETYSDMVNRSMNSVLMRSLNTSVVASLPVFSLLIVGSYLFGALTIRDFALALTVGLLTGAYSSICTATPILAMLKEREPRYRSLRERVTARAGTAGADAVAPAKVAARTGPKADAPKAADAATPAGAPGPADNGAPPATPQAARPTPPRRTGPPPRPRQQRRKRK